MLFIPLLLLGIVLYFTERRVLSAVIFFFFMSGGFQFVPDSLFDTKIGIEKPVDFALLYVGIIFVIGCFKYSKDFIVKNKLTYSIGAFLLFICVSIGVSKYAIGVGNDDILRTSRLFFFVLAYFVFRRFTIEELTRLMRVLFLITLVGCTLYVIQSLTGRPILSGTRWVGSFGKINRYYNIPILYYCFLAYSIFANPLKGYSKYFSIAIFILVSVVSLHRGLMLSVFVVAFLGIFIKEGGLKGTFRYLLIGGICLLPVMDVLLDRFSDSTSQDIDSVLQGAFMEYGEELSIDGTFLFRMALFYERYEYVMQEPIRMVFGVGFMAEGSAIANKIFDFKIGLSSDDQVITQLNTGDLAWVLFLLRLGFLGTVIYLFIYFVLGKFFYKRKADPLALSFLLYIVLLLVNSVSAVEIFLTYMVVIPFIVYIILEKRDEEKDIKQINHE